MSLDVFSFRVTLPAAEYGARETKYQWVRKYIAVKKLRTRGVLKCFHTLFHLIMIKMLLKAIF